MDCLIKKRFFFLVAFLSFLLTILFPVSTYAEYSSVSLSPSSGTIYGDSTEIVLNVNSGSDEYVGVDLNLAFTGSVQYLSATESKCSSFQVTLGEGTINVECLFIGDGSAYSGPVATLYFKGTAEGSSTFSFSSTDPNAPTKSGATYTVTSANTPDSGDNTGDPVVATLPETGIFDTPMIIFGGLFLIFLGLFSGTMINVLHSLKLLTDKNKEKKDLARTENRREGLEKKF